MGKENKWIQLHADQSQLERKAEKLMAKNLVFTKTSYRLEIVKETIKPMRMLNKNKLNQKSALGVKCLNNKELDASKSIGSTTASSSKEISNEDSENATKKQNSLKISKKSETTKNKFIAAVNYKHKNNQYNQQTKQESRTNRTERIGASMKVSSQTTQSLKLYKQLLEMAKLATIAQRYKDAYGAMIGIVQMDRLLSADERLLLWGVSKVMLDKQHRFLSNYDMLTADMKLDITFRMRAKVKNEMKELTTNLLDLIEGQILLAMNTDVEAVVFYYRIKADIYRYLLTVQYRIVEAFWVEQAHQAYAAAIFLSTRYLHQTHEQRLSTVLNYAVFVSDILHNRVEAIQLLMDHTFCTSLLVDMDEVSMRSKCILRNMKDLCDKLNEVSDDSHSE